jgi:hypothetical protein
MNVPLPAIPLQVLEQLFMSILRRRPNLLVLLILNLLRKQMLSVVAVTTLLLPLPKKSRYVGCEMLNVEGCGCVVYVALID